LGGTDWDAALAKYLLSRYNSDNNTQYTMESDAKLRNDLMITAEDKKKSLSARDSVNAVVTFDGNSSRIEITRAIFDQLTAFCLDETIEKTKEVIEIASGKGFTKIDEVLLVGGSSRMPQIKARVDAEFGCDSKLTDPDECVAKGAAIFAMNEAYATATKEYEDGTRDEKPKSIGKSFRTNIVNVTSKSYGTDMQVDGKDMVKNLIFANTVLNNCRAEDTFYTVNDNQSAVQLFVYESDVTDPENDKIIAPSTANLIDESVLTLSKKYPKQTPVKVIFEIDEEGILSVHGVVGTDSVTFNLKIKGVKDDSELARATEKMANVKVQ
jgi:molecular chaperone DnaK (HSP70)